MRIVRPVQDREARATGRDWPMFAETMAGTARVDNVDQLVRTAIGDMNLTETIEGPERYPVNLRYPRAVRDSLEKLRMLPVVTPGGQQIPLQSVADIRIEDGAPMIKSENARLTGWVLVDIEDTDVGSYVQAAREAVAEHVSLPPGYSIAWSGQYEFMVRAVERITP